MIEKHGAVENLEEILSIDGVDMIQWGGSDYSMSVGRPGERNSPELKAVERKVIETALNMGVPPRAKAEVHVIGDDGKQKIIEAEFAMLSTLAGIDALKRAEQKPEHSAGAVVGDLEVYVPLEGLIDLRVERSRLDKEIARHEGMLSGVEKKLDNDSFLQRAPEDIVQREQAKRRDLEERLEKLRKNRASLD